MKITGYKFAALAERTVRIKLLRSRCPRIGCDGQLKADIDKVHMKRMVRCRRNCGFKISEVEMRTEIAKLGKSPLVRKPRPWENVKKVDRDKRHSFRP